jgi:hypothetical protein
MTEQRFKRKPYYNIYKPSKNEGAGAALQFSYDESKRGIFLEAARRAGDYPSAARSSSTGARRLSSRSALLTSVNSYFYSLGQRTTLLAFTSRKTVLTYLH